MVSAGAKLECADIVIAPLSGAAGVASWGTGALQLERQTTADGMLVWWSSPAAGSPSVGAYARTAKGYGSHMVKPEQLPSDLTLELEGELSPEKFMAAARAFFGCVQEVSRSVAADGDGPGWIVRTREGSHLLGLDPAPGTEAGLVRAVYGRLSLGIAELATGHPLFLETGNSRPATGPWLPDAAVSHLKTLSEMSDRPQRNPVAVRFWIDRQPTITGATARQPALMSKTSNRFPTI